MYHLGTEGSNPSLSEKVTTVKFKDLLRTVLPALRSYCKAFVTYIRTNWPHFKQWLVYVKDDSRSMMVFFREVYVVCRPYIQRFLRTVKTRAIIAYRYVRDIKQHWPEIQSLIDRLKGHAQAAIDYVKNIRQHWPVIKKWLLFAGDRAAAILRYLKDIRLHWPELKAAARAYRDEAYKPRYSKYFAAAGYVPFIGWLIPLYLKENDKFCREHGKLGFGCAIFFTSILMGIFFFNLVFIPRDWRVIRLVLVSMTYMTYVAYFPLCFRGIYSACHEKKLEMRSMEKYMHCIEL